MNESGSTPGAFDESGRGHQTQKTLLDIEKIQPVLIGHDALNKRVIPNPQRTSIFSVSINDGDESNDEDDDDVEMNQRKMNSSSNVIKLTHRKQVEDHRGFVLFDENKESQQMELSNSSDNDGDDDGTIASFKTEQTDDGNNDNRQGDDDDTHWHSMEEAARNDDNLSSIKVEEDDKATDDATTESESESGSLNQYMSSFASNAPKITRHIAHDTHDSDDEEVSNSVSPHESRQMREDGDEWQDSDDDDEEDQDKQEEEESDDDSDDNNENDQDEQREEEESGDSDDDSDDEEEDSSGQRDFENQMAIVNEPLSTSESDPDDPEFQVDDDQPKNKSKRKKMDKARQDIEGMFLSSLEPKMHNESGQCTVKDHIRSCITNFEYFHVYDTYCMKKLCIKSRYRKLNVKCWQGFNKGEECNIYSNGHERCAVGTDTHYDIIYAPYALCKVHRGQTIRIFNCKDETEKLYLGEGDQVVWSNGVPYEWYTGIPFVKHQTCAGARRSFNLRYHYHSVLLRVCAYLYMLVYVCVLQ